MKSTATKARPFMEIELPRRIDPELLPTFALASANHAASLTASVLAAEAFPAFQLYLREIGQVKLLSPEQEIELASRIKRGDENAREQMIKGNLRLVVKIARDYEGLGLSLLDLVNEGNIGLMKAIERFDPEKAKFSTYALWWIKQSIMRALANQTTKTIRLPVHAVDKLPHHSIRYTTCGSCGQRRVGA